MKDLVAKQKVTSELRQANLSQEKILEDHESNIWRRGLYLNRQYRDALNQFGVEPQPFPGTGDAIKFFQRPSALIMDPPPPHTHTHTDLARKGSK